MDQCTVGFGIYLGPLGQWLSFGFFAFWLAVFMLFLGRLLERRETELDIQKRSASTMAMRHVAPGTPVVPMRVDPRSGIIARRWGAEEEQEDAA